MSLSGHDGSRPATMDLPARRLLTPGRQVRDGNSKCRAKVLRPYRLQHGVAMKKTVTASIVLFLACGANDTNRELSSAATSFSAGSVPNALDRRAESNQPDGQSSRAAAALADGRALYVYDRRITAADVERRLGEVVPPQVSDSRRERARQAVINELVDEALLKNELRVNRKELPTLEPKCSAKGAGLHNPCSMASALAEALIGETIKAAARESWKNMQPRPATTDSRELLELEQTFLEQFKRRAFFVHAHNLGDTACRAHKISRELCSAE